MKPRHPVPLPFEKFTELNLTALSNAMWGRTPFLGISLVNKAISGTAGLA